MKKLIYILAFVGITTISCEPLEDAFAELDALPEVEVINIQEVEYTLTEEDYADVDATTDEDNVERFGNFSSIDDAKELLPDFLSAKYEDFTNGSSALVTYNLFNPNSIQGETVVYEVTTADYEAQGGSVGNFGNFSSQGHINTFLDFKYPDVQIGTLVELTYKFFSGGVQTLTNKFFRTNENEWSQPSTLTNDDYTAMGQDFPNFSSEETAEFRISIYLKTLVPFAMAEDKQLVLYTYTFIDDNNDRQFEDRLLTYEYDGDKWNLIGAVVEDTIQFGLKNDIWVPDNTIRYTFVADDYAYVVTALTGVAGFENQVDNLDNFGNFNRREGDTSKWSDDQLLAAVNVLLLNNNPTAEIGQQFVVIFSIFDGSSGTEELSVILDETGVYVLNN